MIIHFRKSSTFLSSAAEDGVKSVEGNLKDLGILLFEFINLKLTVSILKLSLIRFWSC